jgi:phage terminase small subunit
MALEIRRQEIFAFNVAHGKTLSEAYVIAGYAKSAANACNLAKRPEVAARIQEISVEIAEAAKSRSMVTADRVLSELARIGFADVTQAVQVRRGRVKIKDTDDLAPDLRAALSEIRQGREGTTVKFHDKVRALESLSKHLGLTRENIDLNVTISLVDLVNGSYAIERGEVQAPTIEHRADDVPHAIPSDEQATSDPNKINDLDR